MRITEVGGIPVIEGTAVELIKLATAVAGAVQYTEAFVMDKGDPQIGIRLVAEEK